MLRARSLKERGYRFVFMEELVMESAWVRTIMHSNEVKNRQIVESEEEEETARADASKP